MNKFNRIVFLFLIFCSFQSYAQFKKTATSGFVFLELPYTARAAALGEATLALADQNSDAVFINPASLGFTNATHYISVSYSPYLADIKQYASSYSFNSPIGVFGIGLQYVDLGTMKRTTKASGTNLYNVIGDFTSNSLCLGVTYSKALTDKFSFGMTVKYAQEKIDIYKASNILIDGGVLYYTGLASLRIAAALQNFGQDTKFINDPFKMPTMMRLGFAGELIGSKGSDYRITAMLEAFHPSDGDEKINIGLETSWKEIITLRGGYKLFYDEETYSFGAGINPQISFPLQVDFAYSSYGRLGNILRLTLQFGLL